MIPRECKRLAEVDFPIAEVSKHAAREKSIRHGHPSTLHPVVGAGTVGLVADGVAGVAARREAMKKGMLDQQTLDDIIRRIVEVAQPEKIILFGSAARGDMNRHSDVDLLIIKECANPLELMGADLS